VPDPKKVVLYELNEVPWQIADLYVDARPNSTLRALLGSSLCLTTVNEDPVPLQPWRTWPTFHTSLYTREHNSYDLGQDPATFHGVPLWDVADRAGRRVGLFGPLQSWPPRAFRNGGFFVPDTFAPSPETSPESLQRFQAFNLAMTRRNGFSSDAQLKPTELARAGLDLAVRGLAPSSAAMLGTMLVRERRDPRYTSARSVAQALPSFDLYWRLHRKYKPDLSVFFTNHVAGMMHRFWGDGVPGYAEDQQYEPDPVYATFVFQALDVFDRQLARMLRTIEGRDDTVLVVAASMGQGPVPFREIPETYVLEDAGQLLERLHLDGATPLLAMYPRVAVGFDDDAAAEHAAGLLASVRTERGALFTDIHHRGSTVSFEMDYPRGDRDLPRTAVVGNGSGDEKLDLGELGVVVRARPGGGNTAYHVGDGLFVAYGRGIARDNSRREVSVLDAAPSILDLMGLEPDPSMQGRPGLFS
jgi:hypothetical protein